MEQQQFTGVLAQIVDAIKADGGQPSTIVRFQVTQEEMNQIFNGSFRTAVNQWYGGTDVPIFENIITDTDGNVISMYFSGYLISVGPPPVPAAIAALTYPALAVAHNTAPSISPTNMLPPFTSVSSTNFSVASSSELELGIGVFAADVSNTDGTFNVILDKEDTFSLLTSVKSFTDGPRLTDIYDIYLDISSDDATVTWWLSYEEVEGGIAFNDFAWFNGVESIDTNLASDAQTYAQMDHEFNDRELTLHFPLPQNKLGYPYGTFNVELRAIPRYVNGESRTLSVTINSVKKP